MKKIALRGKYGKGKFALADDDDFELVKTIKWYHRVNYATCQETGKTAKTRKNIWMHRLIMNPQLGFEVDHINGDRLDNRRSNLRICTHKQNLMNRSKYKNKSSIYKGVHYFRNGKYQASIQANNKKSHLGYFINEKEAALAYDKAALKYFGEFAKLNFLY